MPTVSCIAGSNGALKLDEIVLRNVAHAVPLPKVEDDEMEILTAEQVAETLRRIGDHPLYPIVKFAVTTGLPRSRRGQDPGRAQPGRDAGWAALQAAKDPPRAPHGHSTRVDDRGDARALPAPACASGSASLMSTI